MTLLRFLFFVRILLFVVDKLRNRWTDRRAVVLNRENERFKVVCFGNFSLLFGRIRQRILPKHVLHVRHDYAFSFSQSDHCLMLSLLLPSSLLTCLIPHFCFYLGSSEVRVTFFSMIGTGNERSNTPINAQPAPSNFPFTVVG